MDGSATFDVKISNDLNTEIGIGNTWHKHDFVDNGSCSYKDIGDLCDNICSV